MRSAAPALVATCCLLLALGGCGGEDAEPVEAGSDESSPTVVASLGDSITAGSPLYDPDPAIRAQIGPALDERSQYQYWAAHEGRALEFRNCGVFGERTDEIALRLDECAAGADALIVQGGINDIAQGRPVGDAAADLREIVRRSQALGLDVAIADVLPWNNGHPAADAPIEKLNDLIEGIAETEDVPLLPFHDTLEDPAEPGTMRPELTDDGDHPSIEGYRLLGEQAFELP